ncbi:hypothetical protein CH63R_00966 [Colletotrichum higginsianum IMI 349063]|uniref:Uncharacterized protein n=1 Tax=Colletotrichum higginsianum (strain IMI 349063) TaxID=759273 RepID=A0A1B7YUQ8_COLHI|nr:hypothetical protein CH63R_00966 [Colletotrichum higginsianum IMI 349063]OBR15786.1 hypothetical protein CH63R_00966 [Colletotrichum higginsianum IMI 349063]
MATMGFMPEPRENSGKGGKWRGYCWAVAVWNGNRKTDGTSPGLVSELLGSWNKYIHLPVCLSSESTD